MTDRDILALWILAVDAKQHMERLRWLGQSTQDCQAVQEWLERYERVQRKLRQDDAPETPRAAR